MLCLDPSPTQKAGAGIAGNLSAVCSTAWPMVAKAQDINVRKQVWSPRSRQRKLRRKVRVLLSGYELSVSWVLPVHLPSEVLFTDVLHGPVLSHKL